MLGRGRGRKRGRGEEEGEGEEGLCANSTLHLCPMFSYKPERRMISLLRVLASLAQQKYFYPPSWQPWKHVYSPANGCYLQPQRSRSTYQFTECTYTHMPVKFVYVSSVIATLVRCQFLSSESLWRSSQLSTVMHTWVESVYMYMCGAIQDGQS